VIAETHPQLIRKVISKQTAHLLTNIFEGVVDRGTGVSARQNNIAVAGKTGTSRKFIGGKYEVGNYTASFVGFLPADDPRVVCLIMLDHPREGGYTGGLASAPIFGTIAEKLVTSSSWAQKSQPVIVSAKRPLAVPDVAGLDIEVATSMLAGTGFEVQQFGEGKVVLRQSPSPGTQTLPGTSVKLSTSETAVSPAKGFVVVPDVRHMSIRRAMNRLTLEGLDVNVSGSGIVAVQMPSSGQQVKIGTRVSLKCEAKRLGLVALN
jgi:membrane peptidoglycan carboxypeptidase